MRSKEEKDNMRIEIVNHDNRLIVLLLELFNQKLDRILKQQERMMAKVDDLKAELVAANEVTNEIAADIADLVERTKGGLSEAEANEVATQLTALKDRLAGVAAVHTPGSPV